MTTEMKKRRARKAHYLKTTCDLGYVGCPVVGPHIHWTDEYPKAEDVK